MKKNTNTATNRPQVMNITLAEVKLPEINPNQLQKQRDNWVKYGDKNNFPDYLIESVKKSTTHQSFVEKRQEMIKSEGLTYSDDIASFLENINEYGESIDDILDQVSADLSVLETFAVAVRYNRLKNKIVAMDYIDSSNVRVDKHLDEYGRVQGYWLSANWSNIRENVPVYYEKFNPKKIKNTTQVFFYHKRALGQPFYPEVSYGSALNFVELHKELAKYSLNTVLNGFFASAIMNVKANMNDDQKSEFVTKVKNSFSGSENASKLMVTVSEDEDSVKITPLSSSDNTPLLTALRGICIAEISSAHKGNPIVAGITPDGSTLGSDGKLYRDSLEIYYNTVIRQLQKPFMTFIEKVLKFNSYKDYELDITSSALLSNSLEMSYKVDFLKPEVWLSEYGYTAEDVKPELLEEELPEEEITPDVLSDSGEDQPIL